MKHSVSYTFLFSILCLGVSLPASSNEEKAIPSDTAKKEIPTQQDSDSSEKAEGDVPQYKVPDGQTIPKAEKIDENRVRLGKVEVNAKEKSFSFPAVLNMDEGLIEYLISMPHGKAHETLFLTLADPLHMSVAAKLLNLTSFKKLFPERDPKTLEWLPYKRPERSKYENALVEITAEWKDNNGKIQKAPISDFIRFKNTKRKLSEHEWVLNDSLFYNGFYQASVLGDTVAIFGDGSAFISYAGFDNAGQNVWMAEKTALPERGTEFTITVKKLAEDKVKLPPSEAPKDDISVPKS